LGRKTVYRLGNGLLFCLDPAGGSLKCAFERFSGLTQISSLMPPTPPFDGPFPLRNPHDKVIGRPDCPQSPGHGYPCPLTIPRTSDSELPHGESLKLFMSCFQRNQSPTANVPFAGPAPGNRGNRCIPPPQGNTQNLVSASPNRAFSAAIRISRAKAISNPPPRASPMTAAIHEIGPRFELFSFRF
jgi:hypothetical protein